MTPADGVNFFPSTFPEPWANAWGQDDRGLWLRLALRDGVVHTTVTQTFRWIVPGTFRMGSPESEAERFDSETLHEVTLSQGFWLADTACTQALWHAVTGKNPSRFQDDPNNPVENVSWDDVQEFLAELNERVPGVSARLPTEAEWEYACRAGTMGPFWFGENITPEQVNYDGNYPYPGGRKGKDRSRTVPVKSLPPNGWGLYEMHGNVWEWCADWYGPYGAGPEVDPRGPEKGPGRVLRGGSWISHARSARSANRGEFEPGNRLGHIGFRLAHRGGASEGERRVAEPRGTRGGDDPPAA